MLASEHVQNTYPNAVIVEKKKKKEKDDMYMPYL